MAGFRKAKAEQAALKVSIYGAPGSGKTFSTLLIAEGIAKHYGKRVAFVDTERGTDFYVRPVPERKVHPAAFDIDCIYTRSLTEVLRDVKSLDPKDHCVIVIDSITHLWEAAKSSYTGKTNKAGAIPMWAWSKIKAPYKELMTFLINSPFHVFILGRQGNEFAEDEDTGEIKAVGVKMKAEGETAYEPHICLRMEALKNPKTKSAIVSAFAEKDRTGVLSGKTIEWPCFDNIAKPLLGLLGETQAQVMSDDEAAAHDAEELNKAAREKLVSSRKTLEKFQARINLAESKEEVEAIGKQITPDVKKEMLKEDVAALREYYLAAIGAWNGKQLVGAGANGKGDAYEGD